MKNLILLLLCISIGYACKKQPIQPIPNPPAIIVNDCDTIYCLQAYANAQYTFTPQGGMDTVMTNHSFRMLYTYSDSIFDAPNNKWRVYLHYEMRNATFNTDILLPQSLTFKHEKYTGNNGINLFTKGGHQAFFGRAQAYH